MINDIIFVDIKVVMLVRSARRDVREKQNDVVEIDQLVSIHITKQLEVFRRDRCLRKFFDECNFFARNPRVNTNDPDTIVDG